MEPLLLLYIQSNNRSSMKTFSTLVTESNITVPQFKHKDLNNPRDPDGKFWKAIAAANEESEKATKSSYDKAIKLAKELYLALSNMPEDEYLAGAKFNVHDALNSIEKSSTDSFDEVGAADLKFLRNCLHIVQNTDDVLSHKRFYKDASVDVKAGYVPFKGATKDPKIKYRIVVHCNALKLADMKQLNKDIINATPITKDYIAGIDWNKDLSAFAVLITNSPGYKR